MILICVPIMVHDVHAARDEAVLAKLGGADMVEYRVDEYFVGYDNTQTVALKGLVSESPLPCIVTCRIAAEGGGYEGNDSERLELYERLGAVHEPGEHPARYVDIELATLAGNESLRRKVQDAAQDSMRLATRGESVYASVIVSMHDFSNRPTDLMRKVSAMSQEPACAVAKVAYRARSLRDSLEILELHAAIGKPAICIGMGEFGVMTRVLAPKFGGLLTFASLRDASATAPGQTTLKDLLSLYRFRSIGRSTKVYGIIGWPVSHSRSPLVHNAAFGAAAHDGVYVPLPIATGDDAEANYLGFKVTLLELIEHPSLDFSGASVTIPHKEHLFRLAVEQSWEMDPLTRMTGAANTLVVSGSARKVMNTDGVAAVAALADALGDLRGRRVVLLGSGGVARGIAAACLLRGANVTIEARDASKRNAMAAELASSISQLRIDGPGSVTAVAWSGVADMSADAIVNCTPVGMESGPAPNTSPVGIEPSARSGGEGPVVMDTVYTPTRTRLLEVAQAVGLRTIDGVEMFVRQAALQSEAWTGVPANTRAFERLVRASFAKNDEQGGAES